MINYDGLYNKKYFGDRLGDNHFSDKKLRFKIFENATILPHIPPGWGPGGVIDSQGNFIDTSYLRREAGGGYRIVGNIPYSSETVIYLGMFYDVWGHCITDDIKFIWFLNSDHYKKNFKNCPLICNPMSDNRTCIVNFVKLLKILGVNLNNLKVASIPAKYKQVIIPDESITFIDGNRTFTREYVQTVNIVRDFALKNHSTLPYKKIYFFHGRRQMGEERLANYFHSKGYAIVQPEKLPLEIQLNILANCESFASATGSCAHNMIFLQDLTNVILIPRAHHLTACHPALDNVHNLDIHYINSTISLFDKDFEKFQYCYIISENLRKYFGDKITEKYTDEDFTTFLAYVRYAKSRGLNENPKELAYLKDILPEFFSQLKTRHELLKKFGLTIQ